MTDKAYIGQTILPYEKRWQQHQYRSTQKNNQALYNSIRKYGIKNFDCCVIEKMFEKSKIELMKSLNIKEKHYIKLYNSLVPNGLNITNGGDHNPTYKTMKPVWKYNLNGKFLMEYESAEAAYRDLNRKCGGIPCVCVGKVGFKSCAGFLWNYKINDVDPYTVNYEDVKTMYEYVPRIKNDVNINNHKISRGRYCGVYQFDLNGNFIKYYTDVASVSIETGIHDTSIYAVCKGRANQDGGFLWSKTNIPPKYGEISWCTKVSQFDLNDNFINTYNSIKEAAELNNIPNKNNISSVCREKSKSCYGFIWKYTS